LVQEETSRHAGDIMRRVGIHREVNAALTYFSIEVMEALTSSTGRTIWRLTEANKLKLYRLKVWRERYSVPLEYILPVLISYFTRGIEKRTGKKSTGLGVSIPVLCGDVAEEVLQKAIAVDYADGDNVSLCRESEKERIASVIKPKPEFRIRVKKSLQYKTLNEEAKAYSNTIEKATRDERKIERLMKPIPFRGNPYR
jgi:hypothetical protein